MLKSSIGVFFYLLLQNRWSWALLSAEEKIFINQENKNHNTTREDYRDPALYQSGMGWDSLIDIENDFRGWGGSVTSFLSGVRRGGCLLEIGPGSGFFTRFICEEGRINHYVGVDINKSFLEFLDTRLKSLANPIFSYQLMHGDVNNVALPKVDAVLLLSSIHHIPDRSMLIKRLANALNQGGTILLIEPTHYLPRVITLLKKYIRHYRKASYWMGAGNLSTHHFCTLKEVKIIAKDAGMSVEKISYFYDENTLKRPEWKVIQWFCPKKYCSKEMAVILNKHNLHGT